MSTPRQTEFAQIEWGDDACHACRQLVRLAVLEDLGQSQDWTTLATVPEGRRGTAAFVARESGVVAGLPALDVAIEQLGADLKLTHRLQDAAICEPGDILATLDGDVRDMLTCERILLNFLSRMMGIATLVSRYVAELQGSRARLYDTRKTTPGWRLLEKYAVRCGGGWNHRRGLYDAILIKDNHLAQLAGQISSQEHVAVQAIRLARKTAAKPSVAQKAHSPRLIEIEVDTLAQLESVLPEAPDIVLLDNMTPALLKEAVAMRNLKAPQVQLEASGGVCLATLREIAATGVDRISAGALTHAARWLDIGLDWKNP